MDSLIRISAGLRNVNVRAAVNCLLVKHLPTSSSSPAEYTSSAIALRGRSNTSSFTDRHRSPGFSSPAGTPLLDVSAGGGPRPRQPREWRTKTKRGSIAKSEKLINVVNRLTNSKEEVYGALDAWIAWDLEFPLIAVKKALKTLKDAEEWKRIIQVSKWMLDKGQGKTLGTYQLLLQAFDHEGRVEEAEVLWEKLLRENMECIPRTMFAQVIGMYDRYGKNKELLKVFADMEELQVKPDLGTVKRVARAYTHFGYAEYGQSLFEKYSTTNNVDYKYIKGKRVRIRIQPEEGKTDISEPEQRPGLQVNNEPQEIPIAQTVNGDNTSVGGIQQGNDGPQEMPIAQTVNRANTLVGGIQQVNNEPQEMPVAQTVNGANTLVASTQQVNNEPQEMPIAQTDNGANTLVGRIE